MSQTTERRHDLDALRAIAMLAGVALHGAMAYFPIFIWPAQDAEQTPLLKRFFEATHGFRMPLFFLISGYFTALLWRKRGLASLIKNRVLRILLPMLLGLATVVPLTTWAIQDGFAKRLGGDSGEATIWTAAATGDRDLIEVRLEAGEDPDAADPATGVTPLETAALFGHPEIVDLLLDRGADVNRRKQDGGTVLHIAAFLGRPAIAGRLVEAGAELEVRDDRGATPMDASRVDWAATKAVAAALKVPVDRKAVEAGRREVRAILKAALPRKESRPTDELAADLAAAVSEGDAGRVKDLLFEGADPNAETPSGDTPLILAVARGDRNLARLLLDGVDDGPAADVARPNDRGETPLHAAALLGEKTLVRLLLRKAPPVDAADDAGRTPVDLSRLPLDATRGLAERWGVEVDADGLDDRRAYVRELMGFPDGEDPVVAGSGDAVGSAYDPAAREEAARQRREAKAPSLLDRTIGLQSHWLFTGSQWHHLWFLNHLCWLVGGFGVYALIARDWRPPAWLVRPGWRLFWLVPATTLVALPMGRLFPTFGPDTAAGWLPVPHVLAYYAVFFMAGAWLFEAGDPDRRIGRYWWLSLPVALFGLLPLGLELVHGEGGWRADLLPAEWWHPAGTLVQAAYAWLMTFGSIGLFRACFSGGSRTMRFVSDSSYWVYLMHLPLVIWAQTRLADWDANVWAKFAACVGGTSLVLLLTYKLLVRHTYLGWLLNGRVLPWRGGAGTGRPYSGAGEQPASS